MTDVMEADTPSIPQGEMKCETLDHMGPDNMRGVLGFAYVGRHEWDIAKREYDVPRG